MTHYLRFVTVVPVLTALVLCVQAQTQEQIDALRVRVEQGNADAHYSLWDMYSGGEGVPVDYAEAARSYRQAAELGMEIAMDQLALIYDTQQDYVQAHMWSNLAASRVTGETQTRKDAVINREIVTGRMTADRIAEANASPANGTPRTRVSRKHG